MLEAETEREVLLLARESWPEEAGALQTALLSSICAKCRTTVPAGGRCEVCHARRRLLVAADAMRTHEHKRVGEAMWDRLVGALETACRKGEMLKIRNQDVDWQQHRILIRAENAKDGESRRIPFCPDGRLAKILKRRRFLGLKAFVFGASDGTEVTEFRTARESLLLLANDIHPVRTKKGARVDREALRRVDLHWHDLRHEAASRWREQGWICGPFSCCWVTRALPPPSDT